MPDWLLHLIGQCNYTPKEREQDRALAVFNVDRLDRLGLPHAYEFSKHLRQEARARLKRHGLTWEQPSE